MVLLEVIEGNIPSALVVINDDTPHPSKAVPFDIIYGENPNGHYDDPATPLVTPFFNDKPVFIGKLLSPIDYQNNYANTVMWMATGPYRENLIHLPLTMWEKTK